MPPVDTLDLQILSLKAAAMGPLLSALGLRRSEVVLGNDQLLGIKSLNFARLTVMNFFFLVAY